MSKILLELLAERYPKAKRETFRQMVRDSRVLVNGVPARTVKVAIQASDEVKILDRPAAVEAHRSARLPFRIVHEDADILVVDKPAGLLTSTVPGEKRPTLLQAVRDYLAAKEPRARVGLIHRLDRDASGLLVFSKNDASYQSLKSQLFHRKFERLYVAITQGIPKPSDGRIETHLLERADGTVYSTPIHGKGERAITHYAVQKSGGGRALVQVRLETGRKHQIRAHLAERRCPIVGDQIYRDKAVTGRLMLAAVKLGFVHPRTSQPVSFEIDPPRDFTTI